MNIAELQQECLQREIAMSGSESKEELIILLLEQQKDPPDWAKIYSRILYHTGMAYEEIGNRTIPQILAILDEADENLKIKLGLPTLLDTIDTPRNNARVATVSNLQEMANMFNGIYGERGTDGK